MKNSIIVGNIISSVDTLITDSVVMRDVQHMLNSNIPARIIFEEQKEFPIDGILEVVVKQFNVWRYDVSSSGRFYISVIVALGGAYELEAVSGEVGSNYGFVTIHYNLEGEVNFYYWHRQMWDDNSDETLHNECKVIVTVQSSEAGKP